MGYCAASDVTAYGNFASTDSVAILTPLIARATSIIDEYTGRVFVETTDLVTRYYTGVDSADGDMLILDDDLLEIATDTAGLTIGSDSLTTTNYVLVPRADKPKWGIRLFSNCPYDWGNQTSDGEIIENISIKGKWAYSSSAPNDIVHACVRLTYYLYKQRESDVDLDRPLLTGEGVTIMPTRLPADVTSILNRYKRIRVA